jgi:uncharacterized protein
VISVRQYSPLQQQYLCRRGERHWAIFNHRLRDAGARPNGVPDAYRAALAIENGAIWASRDRGFTRFAGIKLFDPASV